MIPAEAVEAAFQSMYGPNPSKPSDPGDTHLLKELRAALEAAAPYMLAEAWDVAHFDAIGCDSSCCDFMHGAPKEDMNPYRPTP